MAPLDTYYSNDFCVGLNKQTMTCASNMTCFHMCHSVYAIVFGRNVYFFLFCIRYVSNTYNKRHSFHSKVFPLPTTPSPPSTWIYIHQSLIHFCITFIIGYPMLQNVPLIASITAKPPFVTSMIFGCEGQHWTFQTKNLLICLWSIKEIALSIIWYTQAGS